MASFPSARRHPGLVIMRIRHHGYIPPHGQECHRPRNRCRIAGPGETAGPHIKYGLGGRSIFRFGRRGGARDWRPGEGRPSLTRAARIHTPAATLGDRAQFCLAEPVSTVE